MSCRLPSVTFALPTLPPRLLRPKIYRCPVCGVVLGRCTCHTLAMGPARFTRSVTVECGCCGARRQWCPTVPLHAVRGRLRRAAAIPDHRAG